MNLLLSTLLLSAIAAAQTPPAESNPPKPKPKPVVTSEPGTEPAKQEPAPQDPTKQNGDKPGKQDPAKKDPAKQDPSKQDPAKQDPKADKPGKIARPEEDEPRPKGTDPADIAAMKSAEAMLEIERKLAEEMKNGKITGLDKILPFDELTSWPYEDGLKGMPKRIKDLHGKKVMMTGFMLPIDDVVDMKEFLLVQSLWSCCYGTPPDIHGIVRCVLPKGKPTDYFYDPLKVVGTFKVEVTMLDGYCVDIYQLHLDSLEPIRLK